MGYTKVNACRQMDKVQHPSSADMPPHTRTMPCQCVSCCEIASALQRPQHTYLDKCRAGRGHKRAVVQARDQRSHDVRECLCQAMAAGLDEQLQKIQGLCRRRPVPIGGVHHNRQSAQQQRSHDRLESPWAEEDKQQPQQLCGNSPLRHPNLLDDLRTAEQAGPVSSQGSRRVVFDRKGLKHGHSQHGMRTDSSDGITSTTMASAGATTAIGTAVTSSSSSSSNGSTSEDSSGMICSSSTHPRNGHVQPRKRRHGTACRRRLRQVLQQVGDVPHDNRALGDCQGPTSRAAHLSRRVVNQIERQLQRLSGAG